LAVSFIVQAPAPSSGGPFSKRKWSILRRGMGIRGQYPLLGTGPVFDRQLAGFEVT
jgi:hypothetical protein